MINDIFPKKLDNTYKNAPPTEDSVVCVFNDKGEILLKLDENGINFPHYDETLGQAQYLFSVSGIGFYLSPLAPKNFSGEYVSVRKLRGIGPKDKVFAALTANHLYLWYKNNRFCGRCKRPMVPGDNERMLKCSCGNVVFPKIMPAIVVAIRRGDEILLTKYASAKDTTSLALVAGFVEIGESAEETVRREVMEETGLEIKNLRYYKSQPWGQVGNLMRGYVADAEDGDVRLLDGELQFAKWFKRDEIPVDDDDFSLTRELIGAFKRGKI